MEAFDSFVASLRNNPNPTCDCTHHLSQHAEGTRPFCYADTVDDLASGRGFIDKLIWKCDVPGCGCEDFALVAKLAS